MPSGSKHNRDGLELYDKWEIESAVEAFEKAIDAEPENPEFHLNLARALARAGNYHEVIQALGSYLQAETDPRLADRYERLFSSALDDVEQSLIDGMRELGLSIPLTGKAIQMWLEYRITIGRRPLATPKPKLWSAALAYTVVKVNFVQLEREQIAKTFDVSDRAVREKFNELVRVLDIMPADYRYFAGDDNPLDKLVEAAQIMDELDQQFKLD